MLKFLATFAIVLLNAFFVAAEYALVKVRKPRLAELAQTGDTRADWALRMSEKLDTYLSATQLGITASSLLLGIFGGPLFADLLLRLTNWRQNDEVLAWLCAFLLIVFLHVVFGELIPRAMALSQVEKVVLLITYPLIFFHYLLYPLVLAFSCVSKTTLKILGFERLPKEDIARSEDELRQIVSASEQGGELNHLESSIIDNVFDFSGRVAREVMVPRQDMVCLDTEEPLQKNLQAVRVSRHTRYPICIEDKDHIIGVIHVRDLMDLDPAAAAFDFTSIMRPVVVVPEAMSVAKVLQMMQQQHIQLVVVADEYGGTAGLVTMEDLLEEIVGEIQDEHEAEEPDDIVFLKEENCYEFDGLVLLDKITELLDVQFDDPEEDTIGGYVFGVLGRKPRQGDKVRLGGCVFEVLQAEGFRVQRVKAYPRRDAENG